MNVTDIDFRFVTCPTDHLQGLFLMNELNLMIVCDKSSINFPCQNPNGEI